MRQKTYNVKAVVQETGLSADTLRAWERRYGVPQPGRTPGGQRVYSQQDVDLLKWLSEQLRVGVTISRAIDRWRALSEAERRSIELAPTVEPSQPQPTAADLREQWIGACLAFDEALSDSILLHAFNTFPDDVVCQQILGEGVRKIGELWFARSATVPQEHFATEIATRQVERLISSAPAPWRNQRLLVGCPQGETHAFGPLLLRLFLRWRGWDVVFLGADTPSDPLLAAIAQVRPALVILAAQRLASAASLLEVAWQHHAQGVPFAFGGGAFNTHPTLIGKVPGFFLGEELTKATIIVEQITSGQGTPTAPEPVDRVYRTAQQHFQQSLPALEAEVRSVFLDQQAVRPQLSPSAIQTANQFFAESIVAALSFGDLAVLTAELAWSAKLAINYGFPPAVHRAYISAYARAAHHYLDERAQPILSWLDAQGDDD